eukprot:403351094
MHDLEISKPTLRSAYVKEDNRSFLCCIDYDTAPSLIFATDIIFVVILILIQIQSDTFQMLVYTMPIFIIYVLPRLVTYVIYSQNPLSKEIFNIMFIVRIITGTIYTMLFAIVTILILSVDTTNNHNSDSSGLAQALVIFGIVVYVIPTTISTIVDWYYIYVLKNMLDEMV